MSTRRYPMSTQLNKAINQLFESPDTALGILGALEDMPLVQKPLDTRVSLKERAGMLRATLENYVIQMAAESVEYADNLETLRLRNETTGILIALREFWHYFTEIFERD